MILVLTVTII